METNLPRVFLITSLCAAAACAPSLSSMQPAHVAPKGHAQATVAVEVGVPTGAVGRIIDTGKTLAAAANDGRRPLTSMEKQQLFESGVAVAASPPSFGYHYAFAYTLLDRWELNARWAGDGWRLGSRYQLLRHEDGPFDMVVGAGVARSVFEIPLADYIPVLKVDDFTRWTFDAGVQIGTSRRYFRVWGGPKFHYSRFDMAMRLELPNAAAPDVATFEGSGKYLSGQAGVAFGYRYVFLAVELTVSRLWGSADVTSMINAQGGPDPIARSVDASGYVVFPAFGLIGEF